ncbi:MAG: hydrogenase 3 maturation endopeptidase HyCI [Candidatus Brockarchaeota archaeon]|nr:hydrogenase 3 maturation endopeptidase HyCI [Candidatus Brockarchaeota archaeon]
MGSRFEGAGSMGAERKLSRWLSEAGRVAVAGIGNPLRMDDSVGVKIVQDLRGKVPENVYLAECETVPENFVQPIANFKPTHVLLIDAAALGREPGYRTLADPGELASISSVSTHSLPLSIFCNLIEKETEAKIALLLIQPGRSDFGTGLTPEVECAANEIASFLAKALSRGQGKRRGRFS